MNHSEKVTSTEVPSASTIEPPMKPISCATLVGGGVKSLTRLKYMLTVEANTQDAFGIWVTGAPASGKWTLTASLKEQLRARGVDVAVLESDTLRKTFTPNPRYDEEERKTFYQQIADVGALLIAQGVPVIFDATENRRAYRDRARKQITRFVEIYVDCPVPKHTVGRTTPELQIDYEPPETPDLVVTCEAESPGAAAGRVVALLAEKGYIR